MNTDNNPLLFNIRSQLGTEGLFSYQIDRAAQEIFKIELHPEITPGCGRPIKSHQYIHVTAHCRRITGR